MKKHTTKILGVFLALGITATVVVPEQSDFYQILGLVTLSFLAYFAIVKTKVGESDLKFLLFIGIVIRLGLIVVFPNLSDDIYRFIWDGYLLQQGINPFEYLPTALQDQDNRLAELYPLLNSPNYFSIYPPICQVVFFVSAFSDELMISSIVIKSIFFLTELGSLYLFIRLLDLLEMDRNSVLLYWLNPLIIIELLGNLHFEAIMIFFVLLFLVALKANKMVQAGMAFSAAVSVKLLPLMFGPFLLKYLIEKKKWFVFGAVSIGLLLLLFTPFLLDGNLGRMMTSVDLYFQKFEFNASVYYVLRMLGIWITGYNQIAVIGPFLSLMTLGLIVWLAYKNEKLDFHTMIQLFFMAFCTYLFLGTTVHPWYLALPLALNVFLNYRFIIIWSYVVFFSYSSYGDQIMINNSLFIFAEYLIVIFVIMKYDKALLKGIRIKSKL